MVRVISSDPKYQRVYGDLAKNKMVSCNVRGWQSRPGIHWQPYSGCPIYFVPLIMFENSFVRINLIFILIVSYTMLPQYSPIRQRYFDDCIYKSNISTGTNDI